MDEMRKNLSKKQRIVVKVGSSTITHEATGNINFAKLEKLVRLLTDLHNQGRDVVLVTSGAVAVGRKSVGMQERPKTLSEKQACAAIGQASLMTVYQKLFSEYHQPCAQILMTKFTILNDITRQNAINTFEELLKMGVIPIVNENDTVSVEEIEIGDNDTLSAIVAALTNADGLILLSDIDGLYDGNPHDNPDAKLIPVVEEIDDYIESIAGGAGSRRGTGGMATKIAAAKIATKAGCAMCIMNSKDMLKIYDLLDGKSVGTLFTAKKGEKA